MCIYTNIHLYSMCVYIHIYVLYIDTHIHSQILYLSNNDQLIFEQNWMKGRVQPFTDLGFSLLHPFYMLHSSIDKNFSCQSLLTLNLCTLLSLYLDILYAPLLSVPTQALQFEFKEMWPASVIGPSFLAIWILCSKETQLLWGKYLFCLWWSPKYLFFTSYFLHPLPGDASLDWNLVTAGPHCLCLQGHTLSLLYTPPKPNLTSILA